MELIDKAAVVAKIEELKGQLLRGACSSQISMETNCKEEAYNEVLSFLDTLEVKEVNLEEELDEWMKYGPHTNYPWCTIPDAIKITAEHFFELGLKAQKGD